MKIAVYTICKNEEQFLERWLNSCTEADYILITDTGSTDNTIAKAKALSSFIHVNQVSVKPWRFDDARNFSLMSLPDDIDVCICLDMDEILTTGWRAIVEASFINESIDRLRYNYIWSWSDDGKEGVTYHADKIHKRHGFRWVNPCHEVLVKDGRLGPESQYFISNTLIEHHPDNTKSRGSYLELLALSVKENPMNDRNAHYYARDLMYAGRYEEAIREFQRHIKLPTATWNSERSASYRYMGDCAWALNNHQDAIKFFELAIEEAPNEREAYVSLAQAYRAMENWEGVWRNCKAALTIVDKPNSYICQPSAWSDWPEVMLDEATKALGR